MPEILQTLIGDGVAVELSQPGRRHPNGQHQIGPYPLQTRN
jgi:hypothetical protein